ncbi:MAG: hypothetical protein N3F63_04390 [Thermoplasmata archaeon]|nr:hypothetical protein [Thermoplasmata archaeon]
MQPIPPARPQAQYPPAAQPLPPREEIPAFVSNKLLVLFVFIGMVLLAVGAMMIHAAPEITNKDYSIYNAQDQAKIRAADQRLQLTITNVGHILADAGALLLIAFLLLAALLRTDWSDTVRFGLFLAVGLFLLGFAFAI